jgi:hypothetical protein
MLLVTRWIPLIAGAIAMTAAHAAVPLAPIVGQWGGPGIRAMFTATGGTIDYDCGTARIDKPVVADAKGAFTAHASLSEWHSGPQAADVPPPPPRAITISGTIDGAVLLLDVHAAGDAAATHHALRAGAPGKLIRCY